MGAIGHIRREAVTDWLDENGIESVMERDRYRYFLGVLDDEFVQIQRGRMEAEQRKVNKDTLQTTKVRR